MNQGNEYNSSRERTIESIRLIQEILGPSRSLDDVLGILRRSRSNSQVASLHGSTRVS